jgi:hypothetical protein
VHCSFKPALTITTQHPGGAGKRFRAMTAMTRLITCRETATVYFVVAGALIGTALSAFDQFYPIY